MSGYWKTYLSPERSAAQPQGFTISYQLLLDKPLEKIDEEHTPVNVKNYVPQIAACDRNSAKT